MRRVLLAAAVALAGSCGGSPTAPLDDHETRTRAAGRARQRSDALAVTLSTTGIPVCQNGVCTSNSLCVNNPASASASFDVDLERTGDAATVRIPGSGSSLVLSLQVAQISVRRHDRRIRARRERGAGRRLRRRDRDRARRQSDRRLGQHQRRVFGRRRRLLEQRAYLVVDAALTAVGAPLAFSMKLLAFWPGGRHDTRANLVDSPRRSV